MNTIRNPKYFPIDRGEYVVAPGLRPLGHDFGNGDFDKKIFQITTNFQLYRDNKLECRKERLSKYFCFSHLSQKRTQVLTEFLLNRLPLEYPEVFKYNSRTLECLHTGDVFSVDENFNLVSFKNKNLDINPPVEHVLDAISLQLEEDIALMCREVGDAETKDFLGMLHLCSPSHWAAEDKIGRNFFTIHTPIPGIEKINKMADKLVETIIHKGPFVRFIWSFVTDVRLNHHPIAPPGFDQIIWKGRTFNKDQEIPFYFRIERQITWGFPGEEASLFTIGVSFLTGIEVKNDPYQKEQLISALRSMTPESRVYKGVDHCFDDLVSWLEK